MTSGQRAACRKLLEERRREALAQGPARVEPNRRDASEVGVADEDAQALSEMLQSINSQRNKGKAERVALIDRALRKVDEEPDPYGLCGGGGEEIAAGRPQASPEAPLGPEARPARDPRRGGTRR